MYEEFLNTLCTFFPNVLLPLLRFAKEGWGDGDSLTTPVLPNKPPGSGESCHENQATKIYLYYKANFV